MTDVPKPFNVTLVHPPDYVHSLALKEAADYIDAVLRACGLVSFRTTNHVSDAAHNVLFCAHLLHEEQLSGLPADSIVFNSEQLEDVTGWHFQNPSYQRLLDSHFVWDYSACNLDRIGHADKCVIPFLYCADLVQPSFAREKGEFLLFYGAMTPRRQRILKELQAYGIPLRILFGQYASERDAELQRAWAVLNLHKMDDTTAFEPIRCFYPLINDVPVISEETADAAATPFRDSVFFLQSARLADAVRTLYTDPVDCDRRSRAMLDSFKSRSPLAAVHAAVERYLHRWG